MICGNCRVKIYLTDCSVAYYQCYNCGALYVYDYYSMRWIMTKTDKTGVTNGAANTYAK
jgi:hypothetical protein